MKANNRTSLSVSVRRHFVDLFFHSHAEVMKGKRVIDIGGKKERKRGLFDISRYAGEVTYVNIEPSTKPDILASAEALPVPDASFDIALMGELLEHVPYPDKVLREGYRVLIPGGTLLITVPFNIGIHGDPYDYGRYTETYWKMCAEELGFRINKIERQGTMFAVLALMLQHLFRSKNISWRPVQNPLVNFLMWIDKRTKAPLLKDWTTGYGIILTK